ncbi:MAG: hypothetical protein LUM44_12845 [Pyrinomonadaceae bacterium]|nr:hypothetical protein [Pyrinomonadaceae bacterium]
MFSASRADKIEQTDDLQIGATNTRKPNSVPPEYQSLHQKLEPFFEPTNRPRLSRKTGKPLNNNAFKRLFSANRRLKV